MWLKERAKHLELLRNASGHLAQISIRKDHSITVRVYKDQMLNKKNQRLLRRGNKNICNNNNLAHNPGEVKMFVF